MNPGAARILRLTGRQRGFTFVELMMTLAVMAVLALVAVPMAQLAVQREKERELKQALTQIREAIDTYKRASDQGRVETKLGDSGYPKMLDQLVDGVPDQRSPTKQRIYFLRSLPRDPMSADPSLTPSETWGLRSYDSPVDDPREGDDVFDVHSKSDKIGLNGIPYTEW